MDFPKAQDSPIIEWFFHYIWKSKGRNTKPIYVLWLHNPQPELCFTPAILRSELFPDKCWFAIHFQKEKHYLGAHEDLKTGHEQSLDGHKVFFKPIHSDSKKRILVFVADYPDAINMDCFVKVVPYTLDNAEYS
jgi:hypothetical protein